MLKPVRVLALCAVAVVLVPSTSVAKNPHKSGSTVVAAKTDTTIMDPGTVLDPGTTITDPGTTITDPSTTITDPGTTIDPGTEITDPAPTGNPAQQCRAERRDPNFAAKHGGQDFAHFYGTNHNLRNAFGKCVSSKAKAKHKNKAHKAGKRR